METMLKRPLDGRRVHFVAIGGVGMAALAELALKLGYDVSGSDLKTSRTVQRLLDLGVPVTVGPHRREGAVGADHVVFSNAVPPNNVEVAAARAAGADVMSRAQLLGRMFDAGRGIAVTGTHGKTTTASMLARALAGAGLDPSFLIGGDLNDVGSGAHLGSSDLVVAEADEAFGSFLELSSHLALVTNVDLDHLEYYDDQDAIDEAFLRFLGRRRPGAVAVLCADDEGVRRIMDRVAGPIVTYGSQAADLIVDPSTHAVTWRGEALGKLEISVPGRHNLLNAAGALAASLLLGAEPGAALAALASFSGVERRFSVRGEVDGIVVVDDYAHNPQKVAATVEAAREAYPGRRIVALFQPHLYSRTMHLGTGFAPSFDAADVVVVTDVYGAREDPVPGVSGRIVSDAVRERRPGDIVVYAPRLEEATGMVAGMLERGDVLLTIGAGDITTAGPRILELLASRDAGDSGSTRR
jgi:UDP-N-acetylmuramate--alanine ligase